MAPEEARAPPGRAPCPDVGRGLPAAGGAPGVSPQFGEGSPPALYHERQRLELCALHALNNLLQRPWLSRASADLLCRRLSPHSRPNPHRSPLGTGNYDINLVMAALGTLGLAAVWWDKRRPLSRLSLSHIEGFLLNVPSRVTLGTLSLPLRRPHWLCVRQLGDTFYNLDSKLTTPAVIGDGTQLRCVTRGVTGVTGVTRGHLLQPGLQTDHAGGHRGREPPQGVPAGGAGRRELRAVPGGDQRRGGAGELAEPRVTPGDTWGHRGDILGTSENIAGTPGDILRTLRGHLGTPVDIPGTSGDTAGISWGHLRTSQGHLETPGDTWGHLGTSRGWHCCILPGNVRIFWDFPARIWGIPEVQPRPRW